MKPFDLQQVLAGADVVTRCGAPVIEITYLEKAGPRQHSVFAALQDGTVIAAFADGRSHFRELFEDVFLDQFDLFIVDGSNESQAV